MAVHVHNLTFKLHSDSYQVVVFNRGNGARDLREAVDASHEVVSSVKCAVVIDRGLEDDLGDLGQTSGMGIERGCF